MSGICCNTCLDRRVAITKLLLHGFRDTLLDTSGGELLTEELQARQQRREARRRRKQARKEQALAAAAQEVKNCCVHLEKDFSEIPEGSAAREKFCADFVSDLCNSLGVTPDCIELGMGATLVSSQLSPAQLIGTPAKPNRVDK